MSRMRLRKSTRVGEYEVYPIYELDYEAINAMGIVTEQTSDNVGSKANKYRQWRSINNNLVTAMSLNIPKSEVDEGNIIPYWHRFNNIVSGRYTFDQDVLSSFAAVEQGVRPDDWGTNPNYVQLVNETRESHNITFAYPINKTDSWSGSTSYYEDTKRTQLRMFYTDDGYSFSVSKATDYVNARAYIAGHFINWTSSSPGYDYTDENNVTYNRSYKISSNIAITGTTSGWQYWEQGYNCPMIFVHYNDGTTDFFGIALLQMSDFTKNAYPIAIEVSVFDSKWWGTSIIAGGGGEGQWTNDGPPSYVQGGRGRFFAPSDDRGDRTGGKAESIKNDWNNAETSLTTTGYNRYVLGVDNSIGVDDAAAFGQFCQQLWAPDVWDSITNKYYNPISSILVSHMMPKELAPPLTTGQATRDHIYAAQTVLTPDYTVSRFLRKNISKHIGDIDISNYTDAFADYTNTAIFIHLPYVGTYQLDVSACMGGWLSVDYLVDVFSGDITALITTCDKDGHSQLRYSWKGNCAKDIPLQQRVGPSAGIAIGLAKTAAMAAISVPMAIASGVGEVMSSGGLTVGEALKATWEDRGAMFPSLGKDIVKTAGASVMTGIGNAAQSALQSSLITTSSNAEGGSLTSPIDTQCWVLISRPQWSAPDEYGKLFGYPSDIGGTINHSDTEVGDPFTNFLSVRSIKLDNIAATNEEKAEIYNLMATGVFTTNE